MSSRTTRTSNKRNATAMSDLPEASPSTKRARPQKRTKTESANPTSAPSSKSGPDKDTNNESPKTTPTSSKAKAPRISTNGHLQLIESEGDIFKAPPNTLIIHACNTDGVWSAGIARAFLDRYPEAFDEHAAHCKKHGESLLDTAQLIRPMVSEGKGKANKHFVGCLFTSRHYGRRKDKPARIVEATAPAMIDLLEQVDEWNAKHEDGEKVGEVRICKINSGLFHVPWERTKKVLEGIDVEGSDVKVIKVVSLPS